MALTINTKTYTANNFAGKAVSYVGPSKSASVKDDFRLAAQDAKPTTVFSGVQRCSSKMTRTHTLTGALTPTGDSIAALDVSIAVGTASADIDALLNDFGNWVSSAAFKDAVKKQLVNQ